MVLLVIEVTAILFDFEFGPLFAEAVHLEGTDVGCEGIDHMWIYVVFIAESFSEGCGIVCRANPQGSSFVITILDDHLNFAS